MRLSEERGEPMEDLLAELLEAEFPDWEVLNDAVLICPCGNEIEYDGHCPEGCVSPLLAMGMI
jgi:hypothetical protein